jgi:hypothetical protein
MLGSEVLEVGIGIALLFLFMSLIATAAQEGLEALLKRRAVDLEKGLSQLLDSPTALSALYNNPFVFSLYRSGSYEEAKRTTWFKTGDLPSYIPKSNFVSALLDLVSRGEFTGSLTQADLDRMAVAARTAATTARADAAQARAAGAANASSLDETARAAEAVAEKREQEQKLGEAAAKARKAADDAQAQLSASPSNDAFKEAALNAEHKAIEAETACPPFFHSPKSWQRRQGRLTAEISRTTKATGFSRSGEATLDAQARRASSDRIVCSVTAVAESAARADRRSWHRPHETEGRH